MSFEQRIRIGQSFEEHVYNYLTNHESVVSVIRNGTEHTHPDFVKLLRGNSSIESIFIRHAPDGIYLLDDDRSVFYECKAGLSIEKDSYETCIQYFTLGFNLKLYCLDKKTNQVYAQYIQKIKLSGDDWRYPRRDNRKTNGSGTPYRFMDLDSFEKKDFGIYKIN